MYSSHYSCSILLVVALVATIADVRFTLAQSTNCTLAVCSNMSCDVQQVTGLSTNDNYMTVDVASHTVYHISGCASLLRGTDARGGSSIVPFLVYFVSTQPPSNVQVPRGAPGDWCTLCIVNISITVSGTEGIVPQVLIEATAIDSINIVFEGVRVEFPVVDVNGPPVGSNPCLGFSMLFVGSTSCGASSSLVTIRTVAPQTPPVGGANSTIQNVAFGIQNVIWKSVGMIFSQLLEISHGNFPPSTTASVTTTGVEVTIRQLNFTSVAAAPPPLLSFVSATYSASLLEKAQISVADSSVVVAHFGPSDPQTCLWVVSSFFSLRNVWSVVRRSVISCTQLLSPQMYPGAPPQYRVMAVDFQPSVLSSLTLCNDSSIATNVSFEFVSVRVDIFTPVIEKSAMTMFPNGVSLLENSASVIVMQGYLGGSCVRPILINCSIFAQELTGVLRADTSGHYIDAVGMRTVDGMNVTFVKSDIKILMSGAFLPAYTSGTSGRILTFDGQVHNSTFAFFHCRIRCELTSGAVPSTSVGSNEFAGSVLFWKQQNTTFFPTAKASTPLASLLRAQEGGVVMFRRIFSSSITMIGVKADISFSNGTMYAPKIAFSLGPSASFQATLIYFSQSLGPEGDQTLIITSSLAISIKDCQLRVTTEFIAFDGVFAATAVVYPAPTMLPLLMTCCLVAFTGNVPALAWPLTISLENVSTRLEWLDIDAPPTQFQKVTLLRLPVMLGIGFPGAGSVASLMVALGLPRAALDAMQSLLQGVTTLSLANTYGANLIVIGRNVTHELVAQPQLFLVSDAGQLFPAAQITVVMLPGTVENMYVRYTDVRLLQNISNASTDRSYYADAHLVGFDSGISVVSNSSFFFSRINLPRTESESFADQPAFVDGCCNISLTLPYQQRLCSVQWGEGSALVIEDAALLSPVPIVTGSPVEPRAVIGSIAMSDSTATVAVRRSFVIGFTSLFSIATSARWAQLIMEQENTTMILIWCNAVLPWGRTMTTLASYPLIAADMPVTFVGVPTVLVARVNDRPKEMCPLVPAIQRKTRAAVVSLSTGGVWVAGAVSSSISLTGVVASLSFGRMIGLVSASTCSSISDAAEQDTDYYSSPTQLNSPPLEGQSIRGAVIGNIFVIWVPFVILCAIAALLYVAYQSCSPQRGGKVGQGGRIALLTRIGVATSFFALPGNISSLITPLLQPTLTFSISLLRMALSGTDAALGVFGCVVCCGYVASLSCPVVLWCIRSHGSIPVRDNPRFPQSFPSRSHHSPDTAKDGALKASCWFLWLEWKRLCQYVGSERYLLQKSWPLLPYFKPLVSSAAPRREWWFVFEFVVSVALAVLGGSLPTTPTGCTAVRWCAVAVCLCHSSCSTIFRPMNSRLEDAVLYVTSGLNLSMSLAAALDPDDSSGVVAWGTVISGNMVMALIIISFPICFSRWWLRREHPDEEGPETPIRQSRPLLFVPLRKHDAADNRLATLLVLASLRTQDLAGSISPSSSSAVAC